jgi:VWFA-related protein
MAGGGKMRRLVIAFVTAVVTGPAVLGQTSQAPVFRGGVTLVSVDVTVLDHDGKCVPGLSADDFEVKLDGHVRPVRAVAYEETATPVASTASSPVAPTHETTNAEPAAEPRLFVVLIDDLFIAPTRDKGMFQAASRFVADLPAADVVGFTTTSGVGTVNPTRNRAAVEAAIRRAAGQFIDPRDVGSLAVGLDEAQEIAAGDEPLLKNVVGRDCFNGATPTASQMTSSCAEDVGQKVRRMDQLVQDTIDRQILSYTAVINAMRQAPGRKFLVLLSDGLVVPNRSKSGGALSLEPIARAASAAGVQLNVLFADPDAVSMTVRDHTAAEVLRADGQAVMQGIETMADMTGGNFWRVMGQPDRFFSFVMQSTAGVYHLGVEAPAGSLPGHDFTLAARVTRSGLTTHANRVAILPTPTRPVPVDEQLQAVLLKGVPNYGVPSSVATVVRRGDTAAALELGANVEVPSSVPGPLTVVFGLVDATGKLRSGRKTIEAPTDGGDYRVSLSLAVSAGSYRLRFGVADAAGRVGSLDAPVTAQLRHVGAVLTSDVMTSWSGTDGKPQFLALEEVPPTATSLRTFLELYAAPDAPMPADVRVQWTVIGGTTMQPVVEQSVVPVQTTDRSTAAGQFALNTLASGTYEIRATVLVAGRAVGTVSTTFRKADKGGFILNQGRVAAAARR